MCYFNEGFPVVRDSGLDLSAIYCHTIEITYSQGPMQLKLRTSADELTFQKMVLHGII